MSFFKFKCIAVEGNIARRVVTFCNNLEKLDQSTCAFTYKVIDPTNMFQNMTLKDAASRNPLQEYNSNQALHAAAFLLWILKCLDDLYERTLEEINKLKKPIQLLIFDRSLDFCNIFLNTQRARRYVTDLEYFMVKHHIDKLHSKYFGPQKFACEKICYIETPFSFGAKCFDHSENIYNTEIASYQHFLGHFYQSHLWEVEIIHGSQAILKLYSSSMKINVEHFFKFASEFVYKD